MIPTENSLGITESGFCQQKNQGKKRRKKGPSRWTGTTKMQWKGHKQRSNKFNGKGVVLQFVSLPNLCKATTPDQHGLNMFGTSWQPKWLVFNCWSPFLISLKGFDSGPLVAVFASCVQWAFVSMKFQVCVLPENTPMPIPH